MINIDGKLSKSIRESIQILNSGTVKLGFDPKGCSINPVFQGSKEKITCPQVDYFGFYALRNAFRGIFLSVNYFSAGQYALIEKLYGPSVALFYTASYHAILSFLALHGRVPIDVRGFEQTGKNEIGEVIIGILTKEKKWIFEPRTPSHEVRWLELKPIFLPEHYEIPLYFKGLFDYRYEGRYKKRLMPFKEYFLRQLQGEKVCYGIPFDIREDVDEFLKDIARTRHVAIYGSFGSDPDIYEAMVNSDVETSRGIDRQANQFCKFTAELVLDISESLDKLIDNFELSKATADMLAMSVYYPWFDEPNFKCLYFDEIRFRLEKLHDWLFNYEES